MVSKEQIRVFVDTNVDASVLFIEPGATTIGELKRKIGERVKKEYVGADGHVLNGLENNGVERINCLFDASSPSRQRENCFSVPNEYTLGDIAGSNVVRVFAEFSIPLGRKQQHGQFVTPLHQGKKQQVPKSPAPSSQKKKGTPATKGEGKKEAATPASIQRVTSSNTLKNQKKKERRKRKRESAKLAEDAAKQTPIVGKNLSDPGPSGTQKSIDQQKKIEQGEKTTEEAVPTTEKKKRKVKDKNAPKRPGNAFSLYTVDVRDDVVKNNPGISFGEVSKKIGTMWKELSDAQKAPYVSKAQEDKERYNKEMEGYVPPAADTTVANSTKKPKKDKNAPRRPGNAFSLYTVDVREEVVKNNPGISFGEVSKKIGSMWKELSDEQKAPFISKAQEDKERYNKEMEHYIPTDDTTPAKGTNVESPSKKQVKVVSPPLEDPVKKKTRQPETVEKQQSSKSSSSSSSESSSSSDSSSSSSSDSEDSPMGALTAQPSGKFDGLEGPGLQNILAAAASNEKVAIKDIKKKAIKEKEAMEKNAKEVSVPESFQWQKSHKAFKSDSLVKLCRNMVQSAVSHERETKGLKPMSSSMIYKDQSNRPDWWPLHDFAAGSFNKKKDAIAVYNAARNVLAAIYNVDLED